MEVFIHMPPIRLNIDARRYLATFVALFTGFLFIQFCSSFFFVCCIALVVVQYSRTSQFPFKSVRARSRDQTTGLYNLRLHQITLSAQTRIKRAKAFRNTCPDSLN